MPFVDNELYPTSAIIHTMILQRMAANRMEHMQELTMHLITVLESKLCKQNQCPSGAE